MKRFSILLISAIALVAVACGSDDPVAESDTTPTITPVSGTPTSTTGTPTATPTATATPGEGPVTPTVVPSGEENQSELDQARARWNSHEPESYEFDFAWTCYCPAYPVSVRIRVLNGEIVSITNARTGETIPQTESSSVQYRTIDGLFDWIQDEIDRPADELTVEYERDFGYPIGASSNRIYDAIDDEMAFSVSNFRINPENVDLEQLRSQLGAAQSRWFDSGYQNYTFEFWWECFCPQEFHTKVKIEVRAGEIVSVTNAETGEPHTVPGETPYRTVQGLFDWIYRQLELNPEFAALEFDPETGFPTKAQIDPIVNLFDDEQTFFAEGLTKLDVHTETQADLDEAKAKWEQAALADYDYEFNWMCFCIDEFTARMTVSVRDGEVTAVKRVEDSEDVNAEIFDDFVTVDALLQRIQDAIDEDAASISFEFDAETGLPTSVSIDYSYMMADEEIAWSAGSLTAASE